MSKRKSTCQQCGRLDDDCGRISKRGLCADCGEANLRESNRQIRDKSGPAYNLYVRRQAQGLAAYWDGMYQRATRQPADDA